MYVFPLIHVPVSTPNNKERDTMLSKEKEIVQNPFGPPPGKAPPEGDAGEDDHQSFCGTLIEEETKVSNPFPNPAEHDL